MLAIIGGSGLSQLANLADLRHEIVRTPYGEPSAPISFGRMGEQEIVFIPRHGYGHTIAPHRVNYRANIWALVRAAGAQRIVSVASVGGISEHYAPGTLLVPHQIIDYTWGRESSFEGGGNQRCKVCHLDFTQPYDGALRAALLAAAQRAGEDIIDGGVYAAMQGPRLETAAEIKRLGQDGADIVGMTGMPEAILAREMNIPYAAVCSVVNWAAGLGDSAQQIALNKIETRLQLMLGRVRQIIAAYCAAEFN